MFPVHIWGNVTIQVYGDASGFAGSPNGGLTIGPMLWQQ